MLRPAAAATLAFFLVTANFAGAAPPSNGITALEREEITYSYRQLTNQFYKKVDAQSVLNGARSHIITALVRDGVKKPAVTPLHASGDLGSNERLLTLAVNRAVSEYGAKAPSRLITYAAIAGMLDSVGDRYTQFLTPKQYADLNEGLDGQTFGGVGLSIGVDDVTKLLRVQAVIDGGPADKAGILADDVILAINGRSTKGISLDEDSKLLRGTPGTSVRLAISRGGKTLAPITVVRAEIKAPSVTAKLLEGGIGYVRLAVFGATTPDELNAALTKLDGQGAKAYVLDLRDNGGGYLNTAIDVSSKFIATGPIVSVSERAGSSREYDADDVAVAPKPLAVLVNKYTASAAEITSGAIQDDGVGTVIGEKTFGKGVVQTIFPLPDGAAVKITTARYLTPSGRDINEVGIQPNQVVVENKNPRFGEPAKDSQLQAAIGFLQDKLAENT
ncbi:MAG: S41 family peptidase [Candidatus Eremiobacteraeota bacterium]|nr:S41 family peptidase [Candidatus Eremiobacteraeota bacterium]MBV8354509.1 S41 family peptidase [Candidatus Eremiobacteraeota bacterium]